MVPVAVRLDPELHFGVGDVEIRLTNPREDHLVLRPGRREAPSLDGGEEAALEFARAAGAGARTRCEKAGQDICATPSAATERIEPPIEVSDADQPPAEAIVEGDLQVDPADHRSEVDQGASGLGAGNPVNDPAIGWTKTNRAVDEDVARSWRPLRGDAHLGAHVNARHAVEEGGSSVGRSRARSGREDGTHQRLAPRPGMAVRSVDAGVHPDQSTECQPAVERPLRYAPFGELCSGHNAVLSGGDLRDDPVGVHGTSEAGGCDNYDPGQWEPCSIASSPLTGRRQPPTAGTRRS